MSEDLPDLYEALGVDRESSTEEIQRAYRKWVQKNHPDKGGDKEKFYPVQKAYEVLKNPERRKRYDRTGKIEEDDVTSDALKELANIVTQIVEQVNVDAPVVQLAEKIIDDKMKEFRKKISKLNAGIAKRHKMLKRIKYKGNQNNMIKSFIENEIEKMECSIEELKNVLKTGREMQRLLKEYDYDSTPENNVKESMTMMVTFSS